MQKILTIFFYLDISNKGAENLDISEMSVLWFVLKTVRRVGVIYKQDIVLDAFQDMKE